MNRIISLLGILLSTLILISCAAGRYPYPTDELSRESWRSQIETDSNLWATKADRWFRDGGDLSIVYDKNNYVPAAVGATRTFVRAPEFDSIKIRGDFQVRIVGDPNVNSVDLEGSNAAVRSIAVNVKNNVLCLEQAEKAPADVSQVVVHISVKQLRTLTHNGAGRVEGIRLCGDNVRVESTGYGNIFLAGHLNVKCIVARGAGCINIFTVRSEGTDIETSGAGDVNVDAKQSVVLRSIKHKGTGNINIINACSHGLVVSAEGKGKIGILGRVNIREIKASGETCVFIASSVSNVACIYVYDDARVGISGSAGTFYGYTTRTSRLMARNLMVDTSYVQAAGTSHMNVTATNRIFATARDYSSIYYYGNPDILEHFEKNEGTIIEMTVSNEPRLTSTVKSGRRQRHADPLDPMINMGGNDTQKRSSWNQAS